jgi:hypothetical protein
MRATKREAQAEEALKDAITMKRLLCRQGGKWLSDRYLCWMVASLELHYERMREKYQRDEVIAHCIRACGFDDDMVDAMKADFSAHWKPDFTVISGGKRTA